MVLPTAKRERALRQAGFRLIAGCDEVGKGAWAGPLVAAAVILPPDFRAGGIRDSKLLSSAQRERHFERIVDRALAWSVAVLPATAIDADGIQPTNLRALEQAIKRLALKPDYVLVDAWRLNLSVPQQGIVHGDRLVLSIAAASIIAKVTRDRLMVQLDNRFPRYQFAKHKGYGTPQHQRLLRRHGLSPFHRLRFRPMSEMSYG